MANPGRYQWLCAATALVAAFAAPTFARGQLVKVDGSSTVYPIAEAVAEEFQKARKGAVKVTVGVSGTGGGFKKFCRGEIDIANASRPITKKEMEDCKAAGVSYLEMPVAYDALTVVIHPDNTWAKTMTVAELKKMWEPAAQGEITRWNQVNQAWPDQPLKLFGPGADSGTFEYFTEAIVGKAKSSRGDYTASEDDNILVMGVNRDINGLGYFGYAYYEANKDKLVSVAIAAVEGMPAVAPSVQTVQSGVYPLSRPLFIYVSAKSAAKPEVREFVEYFNQNVDELVREVGYVPLPAKAYDYNLETLGKLRLGTKFGGETGVGLTIENLMEMEAKQ
jgi:phosphate transport system substrate-binding protein